MVTAAARAEIRYADDDAQYDRQQSISAIRKCLKAARVRSKYAVCGIYGPDVAVRSFCFPPLPAEELEQAVLLEAEQVCPFDMDRFVIDYQIINTETADADKGKEDAAASSIRGILAAATTEVISKRKQLIKDASLHCVFMDVNSLAPLNCFMAFEERGPGQTLAILDIGSSYTNLTVRGRKGLPFIRDIEYGGNDIIKRLARECQIPLQAARKILWSSDVTLPQRGYDDVLEKACSKLLTNITQTLRYYTVQESAPIDTIYVCGGFAQARSIILLLDSHMPCAVKQWNPFPKIRCQDKAPGTEVLKAHGPAMVVAAGLAMRMF